MGVMNLLSAEVSVSIDDAVQHGLLKVKDYVYTP